MDKKNWLILTELQKNSRVSIRTIAEKTGLTSPAVSERINKMIDQGVIEGFGVRLNMSALDYDLGISISIKIRFGMVERFEEYILTVPEIVECRKMTGNECMLMKGYVKNTAHLEDLNKRLGQFGELNTCLVLSTIVDHRVIDRGASDLID